jgi:aubergine-like protein
LQPLELTSERKGDNEVIMIKLRCAGDMVKGDHCYIQFFNIIMRKCLDYLKLQLVGRNYFDAHNKVIKLFFNLIILRFKIIFFEVF